MTTTNQIVAAIDIGTSKIVAIAGKKDELGKITVLGYGEAESNGVTHGSVQNVGYVAAAINKAVAKCKAAANVDFKNVFVGIAGQNVRGVVYSHSKFIVNNLITLADVDQLTQEVYSINKEPGEEIIHVIPQNFSVDGHSVGLNPVGCNCKKLEGTFYVAVGDATSIANLRQAISITGLNIIKVILEPIASADAVLDDDEKEGGVMVFDIGAGTTDIAVYQEKVLRTTSFVPFGGNSITNDIKQAFSILARQAEQLKVQFGSALSLSEFSNRIATLKGINGRNTKEVSFTDLANVINARFDEILGGIAYQLDEAGFSKKLSAGIVITGGGALLNSITQYVKFRLGMDVRIGTPKNIIPTTADFLSPQYSTAAGLLIKGFEYLEVYVKQQQEKLKNEKVEAAVNTNLNGNAKPQTGKKPQETKTQSKKSGFFNRFKKWASEFLEDPEDTKM